MPSEPTELRYSRSWPEKQPQSAFSGHHVRGIQETYSERTLRHHLPNQLTQPIQHHQFTHRNQPSRNLDIPHFHERSNIIKRIFRPTTKRGIFKQPFQAMDHIHTYGAMNSPQVPHAGYSQGLNLEICITRETVKQNNLNPPAVRIVIRERKQCPGGQFNIRAFEVSHHGQTPIFQILFFTSHHGLSINPDLIALRSTDCALAMPGSVEIFVRTWP